MKIVLTDEFINGNRVILFDDESVLTVTDSSVQYCINGSYMYCYYIPRTHKWTNLYNSLPDRDYSQLSEEEYFQQSTVEDVEEIIEIQNLMKYYGDIK